MAPRITRVGAAAAIGLSVLAACAPRVAMGPSCPECRGIESRLKSGRVAGERLEMPKTGAAFYRNQEYWPVWSSEGCLLSRADALIDALRKSDVEGLNPVEYHLRAIDRLRKRWPDPASGAASQDLVADMDVLLTDAYLLYASHLLGGRTNLDMARAQWSIIRKKADIIELLSTAVATNRVAESLRPLVPPHAGYARLKDALDRYRKLARGSPSWPVIPQGPLIKAGDSDERVPAIRRRLALEALADPPTTSTTTFDDSLKREVWLFQRSRGLPTDGRVGQETLAALNIPVDQRINQIKFSMDRWRWLPFDLGRRYIVVNIPEFRLFGYEDGRRTFTMPIIVGRNNDDTATPVFSNKMTYLEFSPEWNVPGRIAVEEMLPAIQRDPDYLSRNRIEVLLATRATSPPIDPSTIAWSSMTFTWSTGTATAFPYRFRQKPGPWNALGPVKFMFPNEYSVYIHGNADAGLFDRRLRMFSHGCVRVDEPIRLARWVLNDPDWTVERLRQYMNQPKPVAVPLGESIPVYLLYWTAWVGDDGRLNFREDIYGRDQEMRDRFYAPSRKEGRRPDASRRRQG